MRLLNLLLSLLALLPLSFAARSAATSFCKCVCFTNSTIIALNPPDTSRTFHSSLKFSRSVPAVPALFARDDEDDDDKKDTHHHQPTCSDCNRAFCLNQGLKICQNAKETDVFATCFQRDSLKDELVVIMFVACTGGLLAWALIKPWLNMAREKSYTPVSFPRTGARAAGVDATGSRNRAEPGAMRLSEEEESSSIIQPGR